MKAGHWLVKSEPSTYSWQRFNTEKKAVWEGVRNYEARNNLRAMKKGDLVLYYHSNEGKEIVGIAKVVREAYADPTSDEDWSVVDLAPLQALGTAVGLAQLKTHTRLSKMQLVKRGR